MYVEHTILILRDIRRVLRADGVVFWNVGDSYFGSAANNGGFSDKSTLVGFSSPNVKGRMQCEANASSSGNRKSKIGNLKSKME